MPTTNPDDAFHPSRADLRLACGEFTASNGNVFGQVNLHMNGGDLTAYMSIALMGPRGREVIGFLSYGEWTALCAAIETGKKLLAKAYAEKRVDEYSPIVPG